MKPKYDMLWKGMVEVIMEDLLLFLEPDIGKELDLARGFEFMDKELVELYPEPEKPASTRVVDKLVKAHLRDGSERWMLLHIEVQGSRDKDFARRMFEYYIRLFSKYGRPVAAIAVLTGKDGKKIPAAYEDQCLWMRSRYEYKVLCIIDYPDEVLMESRNPFAAVMMVAKEALLSVKGTDDDLDNVLLEKKLQMVRLLKRGMAVFGEEKTLAIHAFLKNYVVFKKPETNLKFMKKRDQILGKDNTMNIFDQIVEIRHEEGVQEGLEKGVQEGLEKAIRKLLSNTTFSPERIAGLLDVPVSMVEKVKEELK